MALSASLAGALPFYEGTLHRERFNNSYDLERKSIAYDLGSLIAEAQPSSA